MKSLRDQIADRCVHFNGVQHNECRAGVNYRELRARPDGGPQRRGLPCLRDEADSGPACEQQCFPTEEQIAAEVAEIEAEDKRYRAALAAGLCPQCAEPMEPLRQDGRCVYAACGHRLGQGRVAQWRAYAGAGVAKGEGL